MPFIKDQARDYCLNAIASHIKRKKSILITGNYGAGKTDLLKQIKSGPNVVRVRSLGSLYQLLGRIAGVKEARPHHKEKYLDYRCENPVTIVIDEAQHLPLDLYPFMKIIIDAGSSIVLAGLPELRHTLKARHPDVLSRLTHIPLEPLAEEDLYQAVASDFDMDAFSIIYGSTNDMRVMMTVVDNCRDYLSTVGGSRIDMDIVLKFINDDND